MLPGFPGVKADSEQVVFRLLGAVVRAVLAQGARPSQPGHVHEPPPKSIGRRRFRTDVPELDQQGNSSTLKHLPPFGPAIAS